MPDISQYTTGYDFDGTLTKLLPAGHKMEPNSTIITGRNKQLEKDTRDFLKDYGLGDAPIHFSDVTPKDYGNKEFTANYKSDLIQRLGIEKYYENDPEQIKIIQELNPNLKIIPIGPGKVGAPYAKA